MKKLIFLFILFSVKLVEGQVPTIGCNPPGIVVQPSGETYGCVSTDTWIPLRPATIVNNGSTLPATCAVGSVFTVTPSGALFTCPVTNNFVPVGATIVTKTITGIVNNVFTDVLTVTVPNTGSAALIDVAITGSLGAGGAIGQYEATSARELMILVTRTPGLATTISTVNIQTATDVVVVGGSTIAQSTQLSAISGANTATQTFTLQYRINHGTGASTNHVASLVSRIVSSTLTNITVQ